MRNLGFKKEGVQGGIYKPTYSIAIPFPSREELFCYYNFDEITGTIIYDKHSTKHGNIVGTPGFDVSGIIGSTYQLNHNIYCNIPFSFSTINFTISFWLYTTSNVNYNNQVLAINGWGAFVFHGATGGSVYCGTDVNSRFTPAHLPNGTIELNVWQHFVYTFAGVATSNIGTGRIYKNGVLLSTLSQNKPITWTGLRIGHTSPNGIVGKPDELGIWSKTLTLSEIQMLYNNGNGLTI